MSDGSIRTVLAEAIRKLSDAGLTSPRRNVEWMLCDILDLPRSGLMTRLGEQMPEPAKQRFEQMVRRRLSHEPLQYILGYTEFFGLRISVTPDVLIPRPETEQVVEEALARIRGVEAPRVLDVGTGSGCIALALKAERPDARVCGCDVSENALGVARQNAEVNELAVEWTRADVLDEGVTDRLPHPLDLLISNPPYVAEEETDDLPAEVVQFEPHVALFSPGDPIRFYRRLKELGAALLAPGGWIVVETHAEFGDAAAQVLRSPSFGDIQLKDDYSGRPRILIARRANSAD